MFDFYIALAYIIPNIYIFFRIKSLFISKEYRLYYISIYLLLFLVYPVRQSFSHRELNLALQVLISVSDYLLPFFLYLFLGMLLYDLFLLLNHWIKISLIETRKTIKYRKYVLMAIISLSILIVTAGAININTIRYSKYFIQVPGRSSLVTQVRVAFVADIHIKRDTRLRFIEQFVRKVNALNPDIILYGGDIIEGDNENETTVEIENALKQLQPKFGSYGVLGNHEFFRGLQHWIFFQKAGITLLCDTIVRIDSSFYLGGRYDQHYGKRKSIDEVLSGIKQDLPVILMDHRPTDLQNVSRSIVDVQFSGHTHDGQMFPINLITNEVYELSWGYRKIRNTHFFVTSGLRLWGPQVKTAGKSEIMCVDIQLK
jgi:predicted MPP superfamily phosphohydrolase